MPVTLHSYDHFLIDSFRHIQWEIKLRVFKVTTVNGPDVSNSPDNFLIIFVASAAHDEALGRQSMKMRF